MSTTEAAAKRKAGNYSMRVVTRLTGLTPDTVRAWERRYRAIEPDRSDGGTRRFTEREVRRLGLLRELTQRGYRIGDVARLGDGELESLASAAADGAPARSGGQVEERESSGVERLRDRYLEAVMRFDARAAAEELGRAAALLDGTAIVNELVLPLLRVVGERWERGELSPAHEHLVSAQVRGLVDSMMRLYAVPPGAARIVVSTPPGELHEFGAIVGALLAATRGIGVVYLGPNLPLRDIARAAREAKARAVLLAVARPLTTAERDELARGLGALAREVTLWVGMPPEHPLAERVGRARVLTSFAELEAELTELAARAPSSR